MCCGCVSWTVCKPHFINCICEQVNEESVAGMSQKDAVNLVRRTGNSVKLTVWRYSVFLLLPQLMNVSIRSIRSIPIYPSLFVNYLLCHTGLFTLQAVCLAVQHISITTTTNERVHKIDQINPDISQSVRKLPAVPHRSVHIVLSFWHKKPNHTIYASS